MDTYFSPITTQQTTGGQIAGMESGMQFGTGESTNFIQGILNSIQRGAIFRPLSQGQSNAQVKNLQGILSGAGFNVPQNGIYDVNTANAVREAQKKLRINPTGDADLNTINSIRGLHEEKLQEVRRRGEVFGRPESKDYAPDIPGIQDEEQSRLLRSAGGSIELKLGNLAINELLGQPQTQIAEPRITPQFQPPVTPKSITPTISPMSMSPMNIPKSSFASPTKPQLGNIQMPKARPFNIGPVASGKTYGAMLSQGRNYSDTFSRNRSVVGYK